jgi:hypothetical protein
LAQNFNLIQVTIPCPVCETRNSIAQSIGHVYGKRIGEQVSKIVEGLSRVSERSKADLRTVIDAAYHKVQTLCAEAA